MATVGRGSPLKGLNAGKSSEVEFKGNVGPKPERSETHEVALFL